MSDISMQVTITRTLLSLGDLSLNDHTNFYAAPSSPAAVTWQRTSVTSPFVDGDITVHRRRGNVTEEMLFEVLGTSQSNLQANLDTLIEAFSQDSFTITVTFAGTSYAWACEAADYQVIWDGPRVIAKQVQVRLSVPRSPVPLSGPF